MTLSTPRTDTPASPHKAIAWTALCLAVLLAVAFGIIFRTHPVSLWVQDTLTGLSTTGIKGPVYVAVSIFASAFLIATWNDEMPFKRTIACLAYGSLLVGAFVVYSMLSRLM